MSLPILNFYFHVEGRPEFVDFVYYKAINAIFPKKPMELSDGAGI